MKKKPERPEPFEARVSATEAIQDRCASVCLDLLRARPPVLLDEGFGEDLLRLLAEESPEEMPSSGS